MFAVTIIVLSFIFPVLLNHANDTKTDKLPPLNLSAMFEDLPKLNNLFPAVNTPPEHDSDSNARVLDALFNIDNLSMERFKNKIGRMMDNLAVDEKRKYEAINASRRQAFFVRYEGWWDNEFKEALALRVKRKITDLMLQSIYMALQHIKPLTSNPYFKGTDTSFRIGFSYLRLGRIYRKMLRIHTFSIQNRFGFKKVNPQLILHGKVARLHMDLVYMWWVIVKVDAMYKLALERKNKEAKDKQDALMINMSEVHADKFEPEGQGGYYNTYNPD